MEIRDCRRLEGLISTMPMTALERLEIFDCPELQEVPDLSDCKLLSYCEIWWCEKISVTRDETTKLEAMIPGLKICFEPSKRCERFYGTIYGLSPTSVYSLFL